MFCKYCGNKITPNDRYCEHCGKPLDVINNSAESPEVHKNDDNGLSVKRIIISLIIAIFLTLLCTPIILIGRTQIQSSYLNPEYRDIQAQSTLLAYVKERNVTPTTDELVESKLQSPTVAVTNTPEGIQLKLFDGNALEFNQPPQLIAYANPDEAIPPANIQLAPFCKPTCFQYHEWLGMTQPGESYEVIFSDVTSTIGVQFWGDAGDGIAHVYVDGKKVWEGSTRGTDAKYPGGAFVKYLQISNLPSIANHILRIETDEAGGSVVIYFFGVGEAVP
jgi:hypothetical protein